LNISGERKSKKREIGGAMSILTEIKMYTNYYLPHPDVDESKILKYIATCFSD
jgi:hypothetical protein